MYGWATIHEVTDNGIYAFKTMDNKYQLARSSQGVLTYNDFADMSGLDINYIKQVFITEYNALNCDSVILPNKESAERARDWIDNLYIINKTEKKVYKN